MAHMLIRHKVKTLANGSQRTIRTDKLVQRPG